MATSGVPYPPPTENFPIFIARVFIPTTNLLTFDDAKKYFITYPVAQGDVNLLGVNVGAGLQVADDIIALFDIVLTNQSPAGAIVFSDGTRQTTAGGSSGGGPPFALDIEVNNINVGRGGVDSGATVPITNTALGKNVCSSLTSGSENTNIGYIASNSLTTGDGNVSIGAGAGFGLVSGSHNVSVGSNTSNSVVSGNSNTALGYSADQSGDWDNTTCLGAFSYATGDNATAIGFQASAGQHEIVLGTADETVICRNTLSVAGLITSATPATSTNDTTVATTAFVNSVIASGGGSGGYATQAGDNTFTGANSFQDLIVNNIDVIEVVSTDQINSHSGQPYYTLWTDIGIGSNIIIGGENSTTNINGKRFSINDYNLYAPTTVPEVNPSGEGGLALQFDTPSGATNMISYGGENGTATGGFNFRTTSVPLSAISNPFNIYASGLTANVDLNMTTTNKINFGDTTGVKLQMYSGGYNLGMEAYAIYYQSALNHNFYTNNNPVNGSPQIQMGASATTVYQPLYCVSPTSLLNNTQVATTAYTTTYYAPLSSPALTGNPTAPTPAVGNNDTSIATTAFVATAISNAGGGGGSGQGTTVSSFFTPPGLLPYLVSGTTYSTSVVLTSGIWVLTYNTTLIVGDSASQVQLLVWYSSGSVQPLPINTGQTNIGQCSQTFSSIPPAPSGSSQPFTISGSDTINIDTTTTIYGNFQSYFNGSPPTLYIGAVNLKAIKIF